MKNEQSQIKNIVCMEFSPFIGLLLHEVSNGSVPLAQPSHRFAEQIKTEPVKLIKALLSNVPDQARGAGISIIAAADIHIFVFTDCKNNRFQKKLIGQNTNI